AEELNAKGVMALDALHLAAAETVRREEQQEGCWQRGCDGGRRLRCAPQPIGRGKSSRIKK
ncbi:MAG: hypothetical protein MN733_33495, partial [Nitrososphaera sp.]|nr:hypothetical protein [Nitrososphaera sp.]